MATDIRSPLQRKQGLLPYAEPSELRQGQQPRQHPYACRGILLTEYPKQMTRSRANLVLAGCPCGTTQDSAPPHSTGSLQKGCVVIADQQVQKAGTRPSP